jgi:hypothetical protein
MKYKFLQQLWLATRIWLVAAGVNALLGAAVLGFTTHSWDSAGIGFVWIAIIGGFLSIPVPLLLYIMIAIAAAIRMNGFLLLGLLYVIGISLTLLVFNVVREDLSHSEVVTFLSLAVLSGVAGITIFYKSIVQWGSVYNKTTIISHEN